jgi:DNA-binding NtrC family response regulator
MAETLLVIEDETLFGTELARHFRDAGWEVVLVGDLAGGRAALVRDGLDPLVVISDMSLPDGNALDLLEEVRQSASSAGEWLFLTAYGTVADSVRALRLGAYDFIEKPCDFDRLDLTLSAAARSALAHRRLRDIAAHEHRRYSVDAFLGKSKQAVEVRDIVRKLVKVPIDGLIIGGETGTGKGLTARILHYNGLRSTGPLIEVNCAALPRELLESELFGHEPGAFTGATKRRRGLIEQANGGTLVLDEISDMATDLQVKLLKVLEDKVLRRLGSERETHVDIQVIAASNRDLKACVESGSFRSDLYHRLSVFQMDLPALRQRTEDLDELVPFFVAESAAKSGKSVRVVPDAVWSALRAYDWPGNVRELRNVIERSVLLSEGEVLGGRWLQLSRTKEGVAAEASSVDANRVTLLVDGSMSMDEMERVIIHAALERSGHNVTAAARALGTTRQTLRYRIEKHGLAKAAPPEADA